MKIYTPSLALENDVELAKMESDKELMQALACPNIIGAFVNYEDALTALKEKIESEVADYYDCEDIKPHCKVVDGEMFRVFHGQDLVGIAFIEVHDLIN